MATNPRWTITEHAGPQGLAELRDDWRRLFDSMPHPDWGHVYEGWVAYVENFAGESCSFTCLALRDAGTVRGICPLEIRTERVLGLPIKVWGSPWNVHWHEADLICVGDDAASEFVQAMVGYIGRSTDHGALLALGPLTEDSAVWAGLRGLGRSRFCTHVMWSIDILDCDRPFDELEASWSRNTRGGLRRSRRRLMELDGVEFVNATSPPDVASEFETFLSVEASGWKGAKGTGTAIALDPQLVAFYRDLTDGAGGCEIDALYAEGRCIASSFCIRSGDEYTSLKIGYDEDYAKVAPGQVLQEQTIERCCADPGIRTFNMGHAVARQRSLGVRTVPMQQVHIAVGRWTGRPLVALLRSQWWAQRFVRRIRARLSAD